MSNPRVIGDQWIQQERYTIVDQDQQSRKQRPYHLISQFLFGDDRKFFCSEGLVSLSRDCRYVVSDLCMYILANYYEIIRIIDTIVHNRCREQIDPMTLTYGCRIWGYILWLLLKPRDSDQSYESQVRPVVFPDIHLQQISTLSVGGMANLLYLWNRMPVNTHIIISLSFFQIGITHTHIPYFDHVFVCFKIETDIRNNDCILFSSWDGRVNALFRNFDKHILGINNIHYSFVSPRYIKSYYEKVFKTNIREQIGDDRIRIGIVNMSLVSPSIVTQDDILENIITLRQRYAPTFHPHLRT